MSRALMLLILISCLSTRSFAQVVPSQANIKLDKYGGVVGYPCVGGSGATGFFYLYKDTGLQRWLWCDPEGYRYYLLSAQVIDYGNAGYTAIANAKYGSYGSARSWQAIQSRRLWDAGFNTIGFDYNSHLPPAPVDNNVNRLPFQGQLNPAQYATHPSVGNTRLHDLYANLPPQWDVVDGYRSFSSIDLYDPKWATLISGSFTLFISPSTVLDNNPWLTQFTEDDIAFVSVLRSMQATWIVGTTAPWVQYENSSQYARQQVFSDPVVYSKQQWSTWLCGTRYANLAALNASWGSTCSTCNSSATTAASETIGTGNGVLTSFSYTFLHGPVDPASIGIKVGGTLDGGDCPWFNNACADGVSGTGSVQGNVAAKAINGGTVTYKTGGAACGGQVAPCITVTFSAAPANGVAITATYQYGGWPKATSGGTGLIDEDGTSAWWPTADPVDNLVGYPQPAVTAIQQDMDSFLTLLATQYYQPIRAYITANFPHHPLGSVNPVATNARNSVLTAMAANTDFIFMSLDSTLSSQTTGAATVYNFTGKPIKSSVYLSANPDSPYFTTGCIGFGCPATQNIIQNDKASMYSTVLNADFNLVGADGYGFIVGTETWAWTDSSPEATNWGFLTENDNLYDGVEAASPMSIVDPYGFRTTPETPVAQTGIILGSGDGGTTYALPVKLLPIARSTFSVVQTSFAQTQSGSFSGTSNPMSGPWTTVTGTNNLQLVSGVLEGTVANASSMAYNTAQSWPSGQYCDYTVGANADQGSRQWCSVYTSASAYTDYEGYNSDTRVMQIAKLVAGSLTNLASYNIGSIATGDVIRLEVTQVAGNAALVLKQNGIIRATYTDSSSPLSSGNPGVGIKPTNVGISLTTITNWHGGTITTVTGTDDGNGNVTGSGIASGTLKYVSPGTLNIAYSSPVTSGSSITAAFTQNGFGGYYPSYLPSVRITNATITKQLAAGPYSILSTNLALEKPAMFTSATEVLQARSFGDANDGDIATSWQPTATNPQTYRVDLVGLPSVSKIILRWGAVYATAYTLDWSDDGLAWTTAFTQAAGAGGIETDTFTAVSHRYWRGNFTARSGAGSLQLQEMEPYPQ